MRFSKTKLAIKLTKKFAALSYGVTSGGIAMISHTYYLFAGNKVINKKEKRLLKLYNSYVNQRSKVLTDYPYIDSAVISGLTIHEMYVSGVPKNIQLAYEGAYPAKADQMSFLDSWTSFETQEQIQGFLSGVKGKLFEIQYLDHLNNSLESGYTAFLADSVIQKGWDIKIEGPDKELVNLIQLKATDSINHVQNALKAYPNIDVVTLSDLKHQLLLADLGANVSASPISKSDLNDEIIEVSSESFNFLSFALGVGFIVFSSYKRKDLNDFQQDRLIGERTVNLFTSWSFILGTGAGMGAIPFIFLKDYLLKKGKINQERNAQLKEEEKIFRLAYKNWDKRISRRSFIKNLLLTPAAIKLASK
tara:strand:- start:312 stop:1397 length:1086 start_codon:yes stop_codon:yes gene_type:complete